ncbi:hypothetical protein K3888_01795 [Dietzia aurantiaca]|uniref:hypothetical protein n=1 Tax=Dietzia aurantiaca TaxID=983873 RepID=UPI001E4C3FD8|nr:hypothetical protein [Dietzia aurantiaca]MCD2261427.1 hypothetical protein [Dietzia aurantiaca]
MGIDLGSVEGIVGKEGAFGLLSGLLGTVDNFVKAANYFTGTGFQEALAGGFMK